MLTLALMAPGDATARSFETGLLDSAFVSGDPSARNRVFDDAVQSQAGTVRLNVSWRSVTTEEPLDPASPADPAYNFGLTDAAIQDAAERDLQVLLTVTSAPDFAEGANRPGSALPGTWKPDPQAFGDFAEAVASRYSGGFLGLPRVRYFQAWNEGNLDVHLAPQYVGQRSFMPDHYRNMMNAFYRGVHRGQAGGKAVATGTAPYGDPPGGDRTRPLTFWRKAFCLRGCGKQLRLDVMAHHPINTSGGPHRSAVHPDDASTPDFKFVRKVLRNAEAQNRVPGGSHPIWATELWWESKPPDNCGVPLQRHADYVKESMRLLRRQGAALVIWLGARDQPAALNECGRSSLQSGLKFAGGKRKPAFGAFRQFGE